MASSCTRCGRKTGSFALLSSDGQICGRCASELGVAIVASEARLCPDTSPANWLTGRPADAGSPCVRLETLLPSGFEAYARILHPAYLDTGHDPVPIPWRDVAAITSGLLHPLVQFDALAAVPPGSDSRPAWGDRPRTGSLPRDELAVVTEVLASHTTTPGDCFFGLWDGFGGFADVCDTALRVVTPGRSYVLYRGGLRAALDFESATIPGNSPSLFWPADHAWIVATDVDLDSTYVGCSPACLMALLTDERLEVFPSSIHDRVDAGSDDANR